MSEKKKYKVVKKHTLGFAVGEVVSLSENQAKALVGKVVPVKAKKKEEDPSAGKIAELEATLEVATARIKELEDQLAAKEAELEAAKKPADSKKAPAKATVPPKDDPKG